MSFISTTRFKVRWEVVLREAHLPAHSKLRLLLSRFGRKRCWSKGIPTRQLCSPGRQRANRDRSCYHLSVGLRNHFVSSYGLDFETLPIFWAVVTGVFGQGLRTERFVNHGAQHGFLGQRVSSLVSLTGHATLLLQHALRRDVFLGLRSFYRRGMKIAWLSKPGSGICRPGRGRGPMHCWIQAWEHRVNSVLDITSLT